jgi:hypothetical protein
MGNPSTTPQIDPQAQAQVPGTQIAMSNADDSRNGVSVANQAPAYGDPGQPTAPPAPAPSPSQQHTGWFHGMMARMNQGDQQVVRDRNGNPVIGPDGRPQTQPLTSKQMGRSILAGVLSAMAATEQHQPYRNGNGIWVNPSNEAVAAGQQAFQAGRPQAQYKQAQAQGDQERTRQYAIYKANVDQFKMAHEIADMKLADSQKAVAGFASGYEAALRGDIAGTNPATLDLVGDDAAKAFNELDPTTHMMVPNGKVTPQVDAQGRLTGGADTHYMILPGQNGKITLDEDMIKAAGLEGKGLVPGQTRIPVSQWSDLVRQAAGQHFVESAVNQVAETIGLKGKDGEPVKLDYSKFAKAARLTPAQMNELRGLSPNNPVAYQAGLAKINQESGGTLEQALSDQGIKIDAQAWDDKRKEQIKADAQDHAAELAEQKSNNLAKAKALTPAAQADLQNKQLEIKLKMQQLNQNAAMTEGISVPKGFVTPTGVMMMDQNSLQTELQKQGVKIPDNFAALYAIGHNDADLKTYSSSPRKGVPVMPQPAALAFIRQYINPQYQEGDFAAGNKLKNEVASTRAGTAGGSLLNAGVASNHIDLLTQAADALANNDVQFFNKWANAAGVAVGKPPAVVFQAIADQVNGEVGKVVYGGTPREAELADLRKRLNSDQSPQQVRDVAKAYIGLMAGRINEINERYRDYFGRDVKGISPTVTKVFNSRGFAVGAQVQGLGRDGKLHIFPNQMAYDSYKKEAGIK